MSRSVFDKCVVKKHIIRKYIIAGVLWAGVLLVAGCASSTDKMTNDDKNISAASLSEKPKLVVFISIDQWHRDLLERYKEHYTGGFKSIWDDGRLYTNAHHDHEATLTGPGHSVLLTGVYPNKTGITGNNFYDRTRSEKMYCVADLNSQVLGMSGALEDEEGVSPRNLLVPTLGDLLKSHNPQSKVFSVSGKDRSGILMAGKKADGVFWYDKGIGQLVTSSFYTDKLPSFIESFNRTHPIQRYNPGAWRRSKPESFYLEHSRQDLFPGEYLKDNKNFPYQLAPKTADDTSFYSAVSRTPFADQYILDASRYIIDSQSLGEDSSPDLLSIGLSATDYVGHSWGPYSQEALDHMLRLDGFLGQFFDDLKDRFGVDVVIALSADHGVQPLPEYLAQQGKDAKRINKQQLFDDIERIAVNLEEKLQLQDPIIELKADSYPFFNPTLTLKQKQRFAKDVEQLDYVSQVVLADDLDSASNDKSMNTKYVKRAYYSSRSPDFSLIFKPNYLVSRSLGTTHGSVYSYDQQVPIVFIGEAFKAEKVNEKVSTVDIAPTLAKLLGISYDGFDGRALD